MACVGGGFQDPGLRVRQQSCRCNPTCKALSSLAGVATIVPPKHGRSCWARRHQPAGDEQYRRSAPRLPELLHRSPPITRGIRQIQGRFAQAFSAARRLPPEECSPNHKVFLPDRSSVPPPLADPHVAGDKLGRTRLPPARCPPQYIHYSVSRCHTQSPDPVPCPCRVPWG